MTASKKREAARPGAAISTNARTISNWSTMAAFYFGSKRFLDKPLTTERHVLTVLPR